MDERRHRRGSVLVILLCSIVLGLPGGMATGADPSPSPASPGPGARPGGWAPAALPPDDRSLELVPSDDGGHGVALDADFLLRSTGAPAAELAARIEIDPPVALRIAGSDPSGAAILRPAEPLRPATAYVLRLRGSDGSLVRSWRFLTRGPLRLTGTLPADWSEEVPVTTGIELTFDQEGVTDLLAHLVIEPPVAGRVEADGRTLVFLPDTPLAPATEYRLTITAGLPVAGTDQVLPADETLTFTTAGAGHPRERLGDLVRRVVETSPREPAVLELSIWRAHVTSLPVEVWRYPSIAAAADAVRLLQAADEDLDTPDARIPTSGLVRVLDAEVPLRRGGPYGGSRILVLPGTLEAGWYLVRIPDTVADLDAILQVTDLAAYAHMSWTRTVVWTHDLRSGRPAAGATVAVLGGEPLGAADADGLLVADTPAALVPGDAPAPVLVVRHGTDALLVPFATGSWEAGEIVRAWDAGPAGDAWWSLLYTDRSTYRPTDEVALWGMARLRDPAPARPLTVRLVFEGGDEEDDVATIATIPVDPSAETGSFTATLPIADLPEGWYTLSLLDGDRVVRQTGFDVAEIVKPDYRIEVTTPRHVYIAGETVRVAVRAETFDGTAVPALPVTGTLSTGERDVRATGTTDADGTRELTFLADASTGEQWGYADVQVRPARAEGAAIEGGAGILLFRAAVVLDASATLADGTVVVRGRLARVDRARLERELAGTAGEAPDPAGAPVAGSTVRLGVTEITPIRRQVGTDYDWISKTVVPVYEYDEERAVVLQQAIVTDAEGRFRLTLPARPDRSYEVGLTATDPSGRTTRLDTWASSRSGWVDWGAYLTATGAAADPWWPHIAVPTGTPVTVEMRTAEGVVPTGGPNRYLFLTEQRGIRDAVVRRVPRLTVTLGADDVPLLEVTGVRFTGTTYVAVPDGFAVDLDPAERGLDVTIEPAAERYAPGDRATVTVRVTDDAGQPAAAEVVLRAVDEKLFAIGAASAIDPLVDLYAPVSTGTTRTYASHQLPRRGSRGEGGDATGGGEARSDFRDRALFRMVRTDAAGRATVTFDLPDDLTAWRVSGMALSGALEAGEGIAHVRVGLPFFVSLVAAPEYLTGDRAAVRVRTYGADLVAGEPVTIELDAPSLGLAPVTREALAFEEVTIPLPALTEGTHDLTVRAMVTGDPTRSDALIRPIAVVASRLAATRTITTALTGPADLPAADGPVQYVVTDAGRGGLLPTFLALAEPDGLRAEQVLAATEARRILAASYGIGADRFGPPPAGIGAWQTPGGGIAVLPYGPPDATLSLLVALVAPDAVDRDRLSAWVRDRGEVEPILSLAARTVLGEPSGREIAEAATLATLTVHERIALGIAAATIGDDGLARSLERSVVADRGERLGAFLRLRDTNGDPDHAATALLGVLAALAGDLATADAVDAWLAADPPATFPAALHRVAAARARLERSGAEPASFAVTIGGVRETIALAPGERWSATLLPDRQAGARIEPTGGSPVLTATWRAALDPASVTGDPAVTIEREVSPSGPIAADAEVVVRIRVTLGPDRVPGCALITDLVPSGLAPVRVARTWRHDDRAILPISIAGRRVTWCVGSGPKHPVRELAYSARVVTPGFYAWEPTVVQPALALERITLGPPATIELR